MKNKRFYLLWICLPVIVLMAPCFWACDAPPGHPDKAETLGSLIVNETADSVACRMPDGEVATIPKHPKRTVILLTSLLDLWSEAGGEVVARCAGKINVPPEALKAPVVGTFNNPNVEKIIAARPDLVISSDVGNFRAIIPILKQNHIAYAYFKYVNYHDYIHIMELFSRVNATEDNFQAAYRKMTAQVNDIVSQCRKYAPPKVLIVFTTSNSVSCELPNSQTGVMLSMLGARNIIPAKYHFENKTRINFSLERIVELDPDVILLNTMGDVKECRMRLKKEFEMNTAWSTLGAIQKGRFYVLPKEYFLFKPNDAFPEALRYLAAILYPEFDADAKAHVQTATIPRS
jgi:iron complex transport system substrate-binding protein